MQSQSDDIAKAQRRESLLAAYGRALFCAAQAYDVESRADRRRSVRDLERLFFQVVRIFEPQLFIEAGAKDATASRKVATLLKEARVVAFEANPHTHARFTAKVDFDKHRVEYRHLALGREEGTVTFNVQKDDKGNPLANGRGSLLAQQDYAEGLEQVTVPCTSLDRFFAESTHESCCMWVDVEGATEMVLGGAEKTLERTAAMFIEVEDRAVWEGQWLRPEVERHLFDAGLVPIARDFQARYLFNMLFVRESLLDVDRLRWALTKWHSDAMAGRLAQTMVVPGPKEGAEAIVNWIQSSVKQLRDR